MRRQTILACLLAATTVLASCNDSSENARDRIALDGTWALQLDSASIGIGEQWFSATFTDSLQLPGTTDTNRKGKLNNRRDETTHLTRNYIYTGKAWYRKQVNIPEGWEGKHIRLILERTKPTHIWIDNTLAGTNDNISTPQEYDLSTLLTPGRHDITIMVDNGLSVPRQLLSNSHAYTESTQTNWNGIIGELFLEAMEPLHIKSLQVYPDAKNKTAKVKIELSNPDLINEGTQLELSAWAWNTSKNHKPKTIRHRLEKSTGSYTLEYPMGDKALLWSEFDPVLYELSASIRDIDIQQVTFGLRDFTAKDTQFAINEQTTFLRGKHDACVFPLTGHTPMDIETWSEYFKTCKEYGINHCRFHSWCPPRACFEAADMEGIYLQPELPFWGTLDQNDEYLCGFLMKEGVNIQNEYGNHASFVMFALGNELWGELETMQEFTRTFKEADNRHLYAYGSNNFLGYKGVLDGEDFMVTCRIGGANDYSTHTRGSFSFADADEGGYINNTYPNTIIDFSDAIAACPVPVISHETGQFQVYPNYNEMQKYTGVLRPDNFEIFRRRLKKAGMHDQAEDFFEASGRWSALLYKADIEMDLRTEGFGGFQLLDLQDYPGQGSAYVGMLDAFMDSKGLISADEWREFCNDVVPLYITEKFCWSNHEQPTGEIKIANYSAESLKGRKVKWDLTTKNGAFIDEGELTITSSERGLLNVGRISPSIEMINTATELTLQISIPGRVYKNRYPMWIYDMNDPVKVAPGVTVTRELSETIISELRQGGKILWIPQIEKLNNLTVGGLFQTDYWNYRMFKTICENANKPVSPGTLGIFTDPEHALFKDFPTDFHTNWQWYSILKQSYPMILDRMPENYRPIVQVIDNVERNHKLGLVFEFNVEGGKLLVCMSDLEAVMDKPEARQFYNSMVCYMGSDAFMPSNQINVASLKDLFSKGVRSEKIETLRNISYD